MTAKHSSPPVERLLEWGRSRGRGWWLRAGTVTVLALVLVLQGGRVADLLAGRDHGKITLTADFRDTTGLYVGNDVTYLGVQVGDVVGVEPQGATMQVEMSVDADTELPAEAGAVILQSSLVTDRYIELGPAYQGGPRLETDAHIDVEHTRSPATVDEITSSLDELVLAMDAGLGRQGGRNLADLLSTSAATLRENGPHVRRALDRSHTALKILNSKHAEIEGVTDGLTELVEELAARDKVIRSFTRDTTATVGVLADQRHQVTSALRSLEELTGLSEAFLRQNADVMRDDLAGMSDVVTLIRRHQDSLEESFDVMPTLAQNFARAYDWDIGRLRIQFAFRAGPFSAVFRDYMCRQIELMLLNQSGDLCRAFFNPEGTGALDPFFDGLFGALSEGTP